jgi:hypothetical protein
MQEKWKQEVYKLTFSGNGIAGILAGCFSASSEGSCFTRLDATGDDGSSVALRFPSGESLHQQKVTQQ